MRVVSGIQPTGTIHLGNYFGALAEWIKLQNEGHECFYFISIDIGMIFLAVCKDDFCAP